MVPVRLASLCLVVGVAVIRESTATDSQAVDVRIVSDSRYPYAGRPEVLIDGEWTRICADDWDMQDAAVVCKQLGLGLPDRAAFAGRRYDYIINCVTQLHCYGNEDNLGKCQGFAVEPDNHGYNKTITCLPPIGYGIRLTDGADETNGIVEMEVEPGNWVRISNYTDEGPDSLCRQLGFESGEERKREDTGIRLRGGPDNDPFVGRVEVNLYGVWGVIDSRDGWSIREGTVACRQLGFGSAVTVYDRPDYFDRMYTYSTISYGVVMRNLRCSGHEMYLQDCEHDATITVRNSRYGYVGSYNAGVRCLPGAYVPNLRLKYSYGDSVAVVCKNGLSSVTWYCGPLGVWSGPNVNCPTLDPVYRDCNAPSNPPQASIQNPRLRYEYGNEVNVTCNDGSDWFIWRCDTDGLWSGIQVDCPPANEAEEARGQGSSPATSGLLALGVILMVFSVILLSVAVFIIRRSTNMSQTTRLEGALTKTGAPPAAEKGDEKSRSPRALPAIPNDNHAYEKQRTSSAWISGKNVAASDLIVALSPTAQVELDARIVSDHRYPYAGIPEVLIDNEWITICADDWDIQDAVVVCKQLGLGMPHSVGRTNDFGKRSVPCVTQLHCYGNEDNLGKCQGFSVATYANGDKKKIICFPPLGHGVRLAGGTDESNGILEMELEAGKVEVNLYGVWGAIDSRSGWSLHEGNVACRQLGMGRAVNVYDKPVTGGYTTRDYGGVIRGLRCSGRELFLQDCERDVELNVGQGSLDSYNAGVRCYPGGASLECNAPVVPPEAHVPDLRVTYSYGDGVEVVCKGGSRSVTWRCGPHGLWSGQNVDCPPLDHMCRPKQQGCNTPSAQPRASIQNPRLRYEYGDEVNVSCNSGSDWFIWRCDTDGLWSGTQADCPPGNEAEGLSPEIPSFERSVRSPGKVVESSVTGDPFRPVDKFRRNESVEFGQYIGSPGSNRRDFCLTADTIPYRRFDPGLYRTIYTKW
ncbi:lysyl oxidase homolog 4-like [Diadema setosum]|uniref:lysyl oxidase homolog 4-like n=1 Tax=Diadema setosum TaxID=31175 RepID=UPI003B3BA8EB